MHPVLRLSVGLVFAAHLSAQGVAPVPVPVPRVPTTAPTPDARVLARAKVTLAEAVAKAAASVKGFALRGTYVVPGPEGGGGRYDVELAKDGELWEVLVDAETGAVRRASTRAVRKETVFDFESDALPDGFVAAETAGAGRPARWYTEARDDAAHGERVLTVEAGNTGSTFNLLWRAAPAGPDLKLAVRMQAWKGEEDQGGGLVWRARDADNYYVVRFNPLEDNLRLYEVVAGHRSEPLADVVIATDARAWHELGVVAVGTRITLFFDGAQVAAVDDDTFSQAGGVGLWTKADASTRFDALRVEVVAK
ncbi:MAG: PepSY domain-containing protein [Planctomycetota bacterium]